MPLLSHSRAPGSRGGGAPPGIPVSAAVSTDSCSGIWTAIQLAERLGWTSSNGAPHNTAVILAAINAGFHQLGLMEKRIEEGPKALGEPVEVRVFTCEGVRRFEKEIDVLHPSPSEFEILPNTKARAAGLKNRRFVKKI